MAHPTRGRRSQQLTDIEDGTAGDIDWSPDGKKIAFLTARELTEDEEKAKEEKRDEIVVDETMRLNQLAVVESRYGRCRAVDGRQERRRQIRPGLRMAERSLSSRVRARTSMTTFTRKSMSSIPVVGLPSV